MEAGKQSALWNDWVFRYQYVFGRRYTKRQKKKFIQALAADLKQLGQPVRIARLGPSGKEEYVVIAGNRKTAKKVILTHYESARTQLGCLHLFDAADCRKKTMRRFGIDVLLWLAYAVPILILWQQKKLPWWLSVAALLLLFAWARTIRNGTSLSHAPVRNTSSVMAMLHMAKHGMPDTAYVFVEREFRDMEETRKALKLNKDQRLIVFNCVGAQAPLHHQMKDGIEYVFAACRKQGQYVLDSRLLGSKTISEKQISQVMELV
ncbi:hypothetical protein [uncultured Dubosiella sp.]|uniref:hypothetical protein n=1 Tax=uncultured Dubosiella sp. TaxID=1937011 RepID=UPI0026242E6E|nr:hypothetical protein [uncultured Dubosiella sp.]